MSRDDVLRQMAYNRRVEERVWLSTELERLTPPGEDPRNFWELVQVRGERHPRIIVKGTFPELQAELAGREA